MSIAEDIQKLAPGALVELFILDASGLPGGGISYFHAGTNGLGGPVVWQGASYQPWPVQARGFEKSGTGRLPRPTLTMANLLGTLGALARDTNDLLGARVIRKRTFARYLDAVNFPGGVNPTASPSEGFPDDEFAVDAKTTENKHLLEFTLAAKCDLEGVRIPLRVITQMCGWQYRGEGCGYAGPPVAKSDDTSTVDPVQDRCGKRLASCKVRFGATAVLPYGGFPGVGLLR
ncbi:phage minor tail protein L [Myxococcus sp. K38C18041901]|uniref:phage minor tail protein L n=1 Tax=Myxococcus guangdongensis TaxID=2906760 RepID=UPI0020A80EA4|nr:phage minor tail protein L [Myxococcus guangdongensis]MCP3065731.1 phage minor tail protein L [Myxococcus guangdongensis]